MSQYSLWRRIASSVIPKTTNFNAGLPRHSISISKRVPKYSEIVELDEMAWLQAAKSDDERVKELLEYQTKYVTRALGNARSLREVGIIAKSMIARMNQESGVPEKWGPFMYRTLVKDGEEFSVYARTPVQDPNSEQVYLDQNKLCESANYMSLSSISFSPMSHRFLAVSIDTVGNDSYGIIVKDLSNDSTMTIIPRAFNMTWCNDSKDSNIPPSLLYTETDENGRPFRVRRLRCEELSGSHESDSERGEILFEDGDVKHFVDVNLSKDKKWIIVSSNDKESSEVWVLSSTCPNDHPVCLKKREHGVQFYVEHEHVSQHYYNSQFNIYN